MAGNGRNKQKKSLLTMVREELLFCDKHEELITEREFYLKKCYMGKGNKRKYCSYIKILK